LPSEYPLMDKNAGLAEHALRLSELTLAAVAKRANLVFYAGCRDAPFGQQVS
jgi:hypothetical protein